MSTWPAGRLLCELCFWHLSSSALKHRTCQIKTAWRGCEPRCIIDPTSYCASLLYPTAMLLLLCSCSWSCALFTESEEVNPSVLLVGVRTAFFTDPEDSLKLRVFVWGRVGVYAAGLHSMCLYITLCCPFAEVFSITNKHGREWTWYKSREFVTEGLQPATVHKRLAG